MDADFAGQQPKGIFAVHAESRRFDPRLFARLIVVENSLKSLPLGPAHVHAHQHFRPVLRFRSACSGMDRHDGIASVIVT